MIKKRKSTGILSEAWTRYYLYSSLSEYERKGDRQLWTTLLKTLPFNLKEGFFLNLVTAFLFKFVFLFLIQHNFLSCLDLSLINLILFFLIFIGLKINKFFWKNSKIKKIPYTHAVIGEKLFQTLCLSAKKSLFLFFLNI